LNIQLKKAFTLIELIIVIMIISMMLNCRRYSRGKLEARTRRDRYSKQPLNNCQQGDYHL